MHTQPNLGNLPKTTTIRKITLEDWRAEGTKRFGQKARHWKFVCPRCKTVQSGQDLLDAGMSLDQLQKYIGFSCIGRFANGKGCDWTLGGLFQIHTVEIVHEDGKTSLVFEFAED